MKTAKKIWIIIAVCLIAVGAMISAWSLASTGFDFEGLATEKFISNEHNIIADFSNIKIDVNTSDIDFVRSETNECMVVAIDSEKVKHTVTVENDTLLIGIEDNREWYDYIGISFGEMSLTIHLSKDSYNSLNIEADTSDITVPQDFVFGNAEIETDTGDIKLLSSVSETLDISTDTGEIEIGEMDVRYFKCVECKNIKIESDTGDIKLWRTMASDTITVQSDTGDVWFCVVEAPYVNVVTDTGDVEGDLYTAPKFITKTDTGTVKVPDARTDDIFEITTNTGDIYFKVVK